MIALFEGSFQTCFSSGLGLTGTDITCRFRCIFSTQFSLYRGEKRLEKKTSKDSITYPRVYFGCLRYRNDLRLGFLFFLTIFASFTIFSLFVVLSFFVLELVDVALEVLLFVLEILAVLVRIGRGLSFLVLADFALQRLKSHHRPVVASLPLSLSAIRSGNCS